MKLKKIIKLFGVFSFAFSAAVGATRSQQYFSTNSEEFLKEIHHEAKKIKKNLSQKDQELINSIEKNAEAAGFSPQSKDKGVFDVLKNIATLRIALKLQNSPEEKKRKISKTSSKSAK